MNKLAELPATDPERWRLELDHGAHHWRYLNKADSDQTPQSKAEKYFLGLAVDAPILSEPKTFLDSARNGFSFYQSLQLPDGHWACDYGGPSFLLAGLIIAMYITDCEIPSEWKTEIVQYLSHHVNDDGGWGLHLEGDSTVFATTLYYIVLRIFDISPNHPLTSRARARLHALGGAIGIPQWGKFWLACLNLYSWEGINPVPIELWLLPDWVPFHPWRWWVQCRVVFLPTSYLYANQCSKPLNALTKSLREEIYVEEFSKIKFSENRHNVAPSDLKQPHSYLLKIMNAALRVWEKYLMPNWMKERANSTARELIKREDENTSYSCIAPVGKAFHMVAIYFADGAKCESLDSHHQNIGTYMWKSAEGMTCSGTNGVQVWDTAFSIQAAVESGIAKESAFKNSLQKALEFLDMSQLREDLADPYRQKRKGGWPFSSKDNGYIVSDCSAESMKAVIMLQEEWWVTLSALLIDSGFEKIISDDRLEDCVDSLLAMQNTDGGFASYEQTRGTTLLELLNPAEIFDRIMVEYSYPECTTAVLTSLALFHKHFPKYRPADIKRTISKAAQYITKSQLPDGSWYGSWAICFTYATLFALESLSQIGETWQTSARVRKGCQFLLDKQMADGGWGEHYRSCEEKQYIQHSDSQVVNTAWAVLGLMHAQYPDPEPIERGLQLIKSRQLPTGEWKQEAIEGVFNRTCMIGYPNYKLYFTVWALGRYTNIYLPLLKMSTKKTR